MLIGSMPSRPHVYRPPHVLLGASSDDERGSSRQRGYSAAWDKAAKLHRMSHPLCVGCEAVGRIVPAAVVDHVVPHKGNYDLFWDAGNWQSACVAHHSQVKPLMERLFAQGRATADDLRLCSKLAQKLTLDCMT